MGRLNLAGLIVLCLWFGASPGTRAAGGVAQPRVAAMESPAAAAWLRAAGLDCLEITGEQLLASTPDVPLLIVPLDRIRSEAAVRALETFSNRGGKIIAVYWGTIARPEQQAAYPVYRTARLLGVRVAGWTLIGPAVVQPARMATSGWSVVPDTRTTSTSFPMARPASPPGEERLGRAMVVRVDPEPSAQVLAQLMPVSGTAPLALVVRNGNVLYVAANLFQPDANAAEMRHLFFWILDQASPGLVYSGVRERAGAAAAAVIQARERLVGRPAPGAEEVRTLLDQADAAVSRAKSLAAGNDFAASIAASDQARELVERALGMLEGH